MNPKFQELELFREDIAALKTAVTLLRDWIAEKFGVQVFDQTLLMRTRSNFDNDATLVQKQNRDQYNLKPIRNRTLMPIETKPSSFHNAEDFHEELPEIPFNISNHPIHIFHHINCTNEVIPIPIQMKQQTSSQLNNNIHEEYVDNSNDVTIVPETSSNYGNIPVVPVASTSRSYVIDLPFNGTVSSPSAPRSASVEDPNISSSNSMNAFPIDVNSKSGSTKKRRKRTKSKISPGSSTKASKSTEDMNQIQCEICGKLLNGTAAMKRHIQTHKNFRSHICTECGKCFQRSFHLKTHRMIHSGEKKHQCRFCGRLFLLPKDLVCHERTHTGEKPFGCSLCSRTFNLKSHLTMHFRTHTGEKPYKCNECDKSFSQSNSLRVHKKTHQKVPESSSKTSGNTDLPIQLTLAPQASDTNNFATANTDNSENFRIGSGSPTDEILNINTVNQKQYFSPNDYPGTPTITIIESVDNDNNINLTDVQLSSYETKSNSLFVYQYPTQ